MNTMLPGVSKGANVYRSRLDRVLCKLATLKVVSAELFGTKPLKDVLQLERIAGTQRVYRIPVFPSDHFGVLVHLEPVDAAVV